MFSAEASGSESGSESGADECAQADSGYRVRVCLRRYFADERARALVAVRGERRVRWLRRRLRALFALCGAFALCVRGYLLPPSEPLRAVLRADERVQVIPLPSNRRASRQTVKESQTEDKVISSTCAAIDKCSAATCDDMPAETPAASSSPIRGSVVESSPAAAAAAAPGDAQHADSGEESSELHSLKARALAMLDACCSEDAADGAPPPAKRRRRVRRRPRRAPSAPPPADDVPAPAPPPPAAADRPATPCAPSAAGDVARNEDARARRPRIVQSLCSD